MRKPGGTEYGWKPHRTSAMEDAYDRANYHLPELQDGDQTH